MPSIPPPGPPLPPPPVDVDNDDGNESGGESAEEFVFDNPLPDPDDLAAFPDSDATTEDEERPIIPSLVEGDEEISGRSDVAAILKILDERILLNGANANNAAYNPVKILTR